MPGSRRSASRHMTATLRRGCRQPGQRVTGARLCPRNVPNSHASRLVAQQGDGQHPFSTEVARRSPPTIRRYVLRKLSLTPFELLDPLGVPGIWFPFNVGLSRT